jgi:hypothetical protein
MSHVRRHITVRAQTGSCAQTEQNFSHSAREHKMLISIELSRERIRDIERRAAHRHIGQSRAARGDARWRWRGSRIASAIRSARS